MFYQNISGDDATVALMAKHILSGEDLPVFFYRQAFMGSLNGVHMVPALYVFGPSVLLVRLNAVAWSLLFPLGLYVLARRLYDEAAARVTLGLAAVPPFLLTYYSTVAEPHFETNTFGVILLLLGLGALTATAEARRTRALGVLGFVGGLAWWTNAKAVVVLGPILLGLLIQDPRLPGRRGGWLLGAGLAVGSLPAWLFYLTRPDPGPGNLGSARRFLEVRVDPSWEKTWDLVTNLLPYPVGSYYFGPMSPQRRAVLVAACALHVAAIAVAGVAAVRALRGGGPARRAWGFWLLLLTLVAPFAALYFSGFNVLDDDSRGRYLLTAYIPLLVFLGAAIAALGRRSRVAAGAVLAFVLTFHLWTNLEYLWPLWPEQRARRGAEIAAREALVGHLRARPPDALLVDGRSSFLLQFLLDGAVVSELMTDGYYPSAVAADAAGRVAILGSERDGRLPAPLAPLGATATSTRFGDWRLYESVDVPARGYRLLPRDAWHPIGEPGVRSPAADGDLGTGWPARRLDASESAGLVLDLGAPRAVGRLVLWPTAPTDTVVPLEVAGSIDAIEWQRLGVAPVRAGRPAFAVGHRPLFRPRNGWLEVIVTPRPVRYLRVRPAAPGPVGAGMVGELFAYEVLDGPEPADVDLAALLPLLQARGVTRLLADPVVSARVALATKSAVRTLPASRALDSHGLLPPARLATRVTLRETDAALVSAEDAAELRARFASAGLSVAAEPMGSRVLFRPVSPLAASGPCRQTDWRMTPEAPEPADGRARVVVEANLAGPTRLTSIRIEHPRVSTRDVSNVTAEVSDDGRAWRPVADVRPVAEWAWAGRTLFTVSGEVSELAVGATSGRAVRVAMRLPDLDARAITSVCVRGRA